MYVGFKFACTIFCAVEDGGSERVIIRTGGGQESNNGATIFSFLISRGSKYAHYYYLPQAKVQLSGGGGGILFNYFSSTPWKLQLSSRTWRGSTGIREGTIKCAYAYMLLRSIFMCL